MFKSNYSYELKGNDLAIVDLGGPFMSVTNNAEGVIEEICKQNNVDGTTLNIVYQDSTGVWDGIRYYGKNQSVDFVFLGEETSASALRNFKKK